MCEADTLTTTSKPTRHGNMLLTITLHDTTAVIFNPCNYIPFVKCTTHQKVIPFHTKWNESSIISGEFRKREREGDILGDLWEFSGIGGGDTSNQSKIRETPERFGRLGNTVITPFPPGILSLPEIAILDASKLASTYFSLFYRSVHVLYTEK